MSGNSERLNKRDYLLRKIIREMTPEQLKAFMKGWLDYYDKNIKWMFEPTPIPDFMGVLLRREEDERETMDGEDIRPSED